jgi:hypothetical protein
MPPISTWTRALANEEPIAMTRIFQRALDSSPSEKTETKMYSATAGNTAAIFWPLPTLTPHAVQVHGDCPYGGRQMYLIIGLGGRLQLRLFLVESRKHSISE